MRLLFFCRYFKFMVSILQGPVDDNTKLQGPVDVNPKLQGPVDDNTKLQGS